AAVLRGHAQGRRDARIRRRPGVRRSDAPDADPEADRGVLPRRVVRSVRPVPRRHRAPGGTPVPRRERPFDALARAAAPEGAGAGDGRGAGLRPRPDGLERDRVGGRAGVDRGEAMSESTGRDVEFTLDGKIVKVPEGTTIHGACRSQGIDTPTLCWAENLTP